MQNYIFILCFSGFGFLFFQNCEMINILFGFVTCTVSGNIFSFPLWSLILSPNTQLGDFFLTKQVVTTTFQALFSGWVASRLWSPSSVRIAHAGGILTLPPHERCSLFFFLIFYFFRPVISPLSFFNCFTSFV